MKLLLLVVVLLVLQRLNEGEEDAFRTSPFHSFVDDLRELQSAFPQLDVLQEVVRRGVDYISPNGRTPAPHVEGSVLGRGFHRELRIELCDVWHQDPVEVLIFQRLRADVFANLYELKNFKEHKTHSIEMQVVGPVDLEAPASSSYPTLLFVKVKMAAEQIHLNFTIPFHAKYPEAISKTQSRRCDEDGEVVQSMGCYVCVELDRPLAVLDMLDGSKLAIVLVSGKQERLVIPTGNADHAVAVVLISLFVLLAASAAVLWTLVTESAGLPKPDRKMR